MFFAIGRECDNCAGFEERTFRDSYSGVNLCLKCLSEVVDRINLSPSQDGDNLKQLLEEVE